MGEKNKSCWNCKILKIFIPLKDKIFGKIDYEKAVAICTDNLLLTPSDEPKKFKVGNLKSDKDKLFMFWGKMAKRCPNYKKLPDDEI